MANTYTWIISQLDCYPESAGDKDVVFGIHWRRKAEDSDGREVDVYDFQPIALDKNSTFVAYKDLTPTIVIGWLESALGERRLVEIDQILDAQLAALVNPSTVNPALPWG